MFSNNILVIDNVYSKFIKQKLSSLFETKEKWFYDYPVEVYVH